MTLYIGINVKFNMSTSNLSITNMKVVGGAVVKVCEYDIIEHIDNKLNDLAINNDSINNRQKEMMTEATTYFTNMFKDIKEMKKSLHSINKPSGYILYCQHQRATLSRDGFSPTIEQLHKMWDLESVEVQNNWNIFSKSNDLNNKPSTGDVMDLYTTVIADISTDTKNISLNKAASIRSQLKIHGLDTSGTKHEIENRLHNYMNISR